MNANESRTEEKGYVLEDKKDYPELGTGFQVPEKLSISQQTKRISIKMIPEKLRTNEQTVVVRHLDSIAESVPDYSYAERWKIISIRMI